MSFSVCLAFPVCTWEAPLSPTCQDPCLSPSCFHIEFPILSHGPNSCGTILLGPGEDPDARDIKIEYLSSFKVLCSFKAHMSKYPGCFHSLIPLQSSDKQTSSSSCIYPKAHSTALKEGSSLPVCIYFRQAGLVAKRMHFLTSGFSDQPDLVPALTSLDLVSCMYQKPDFRRPELLGRWLNPLLLLETGG